MAQKKAFVRYAQNKAVPGSLIVRTKAPKVGTWKEVPYDICCGGGGNCCSNETTVTLSFTPETTDFSNGVFLEFKCDNVTVSFNSTNYSPNPNNLLDLVAYLNNTYGSNNPILVTLVGQFSLDGDTIVLTMTECKKQSICPIGELTFVVGTFT